MMSVLTSSNTIIRKVLAWRLKHKRNGPKVQEFIRRREEIIDCFSDNIPVKEDDEIIPKKVLRPKYQKIIILDYFQYLKHRKSIIHNSDIDSLKNTRKNLDEWLNFYVQERLEIKPNPTHLKALEDNENMIKELIDLVNDRLNSIDYPEFSKILKIKTGEFENAIKPLRSEGFFTHKYHKNNIAKLINAMIELGYIDYPIKYISQREAIAKSIYEYLGIEDSSDYKYQQFQKMKPLKFEEREKFKKLFD